MKKAVHVTVTGAAGSIGYALVFRIASGQMFGPETPVVLQLLELPMALDALNGVAMELADCAFPLLQEVVITDDPAVAFKDTNVACLIGGKPRKAGMLRADLIKENGPIFVNTGKAINDNAAEDVKVVVVANPCNTNALITAANAPKVKAGNITAMTRLDENRAISQLAAKSGAGAADIEQMTIWGNHSPTMYPDFYNAKIGGKAATSVIDEDWFKEDFVKTVSTRGSAIIKARGASSAASAANAVVDHIYDWVNPTPGKVVSMAIPSDGSYGFNEGIIASFPVTINKKGEAEILKGLELNEYAKAKIQATNEELLGERDIIADLLK